VAEENDGLLGYATARSAGATDYIADLIVMPERGDAIRALLQTALADFAEQAVEATGAGRRCTIRITRC